MYFRITGGKIALWDNSGRPAVGYEIHTSLAGGTTPAFSYFNRDLAVAHKNTNPVILNARGEADMFTGVALKLRFTIPGGDPTSPIWEEDYVGEQQQNTVTGSAVPITQHNNYVVNTLPAVSALSNNFMLIMTPDLDNSPTITSNTFNGTGTNDLTPGGAYIGAAPAQFRVEIDNTFESPPTAPTAAELVSAGLVTVGNHYVKITYVTLSPNETSLGAASGVVAAAGSRQIRLTGIPTGTAQVTARNIYMTKAGGTDYYFVATIPDNSTVTYDINVADASLTVAAPTVDTTGTVNTFKWKKDSGAYTTGVAITAVVQVIYEGISVLFATISGHTLGDYWIIETETPARVLLDNLPNLITYPHGLIVYKNKGASIVPLDGGDMKAGYPAQLILNESLNALLLINPATPIFTTTTISAVRYRKILTGNYALLISDQGYELSFSGGSYTLTLLTPPGFANRFFYVKNRGTGIITVDAGVGYLIYSNQPPGNRYFYVGPGGNYQLQTNGVDWDVMTSLGYPQLIDRKDVAAQTNTFTGLIPGIKYRLDYELTLANAGNDVRIRFNADTNNYHGTTLIAAPGVGVSVLATTTDYLISVSAAGAVFTRGSLEFETLYGNNKAVKVLKGSSHCSSVMNILTGDYAGAADLTSVSVYTSDTSLTGRIWLWQVG